MPKLISCGVLVLDQAQRLLLAHATGQRHWDIPKGGPDPGEDHRDAAVRETFEETGVVLAPDALQDLGTFAYRPAKDLHLFIVRLGADAPDVKTCCCTSYFTDRFGRERPEADGFVWAAQAELARLCTPRMTAVLNQVLDDLIKEGGHERRSA